MNQFYSPPEEDDDQAYTPYAGQQSAPPPYAPPVQPVPVRFPASRPVVVYGLMGITIFIFILQTVSPYVFNSRDLPALLGMKVNELILLGQYWRLFTPMFLHGSILHILFNMYALYIFGPGLERHYGHWRFLLLYVISGYAGNVMSFIFSVNPSLGSSTAIFGLLGAEGVLLYRNRGVFGGNAQRALGNIILIAVINLFIGLSPGIDNWGHIGGLMGGALFAWFGGPLLQVEGYYPPYHLVDQRGQRAALLAALGVGFLFTALVVLTIGFRLSLI